MRFIDISNDTKDIYRLGKNEEVVFFLLNRSGHITIDLAEKGARAHIFAFYRGRGKENFSLTLSQKHSAEETYSSTLIKSVLADESKVHYEGLIEIRKGAPRSDASQESRALLLSPETNVFTRPSLEILADDVVCHHAATVQPLSDEMLFFAKSRGLSQEKAKTLLISGFFQEAIERMEKLGIEPLAVFEKLHLSEKTYA